MSTAPPLEAHQLSYRYPGVSLFENLSFVLQSGEVRAVLGPSGSGKTTLLHLLAGLLPLQDGQVFWQGQPLAAQSEEQLAGRRLGFLGLVFQHHYLLPELSAIENLMVPGYLKGQPQEEWAWQLLQQIGLQDRAHLRPKDLSGGERQRIAVARALYLKPKLLLCDEPTGSLDRANAKKVLQVLLQLAAALGTAVLIATHDEPLVEGLPELRLG